MVKRKGMAVKGFRVSHRKNAALHADHGCRYSTRPILGALVDLEGAAAERACKLPGCRRLFALALVDAAQAVNDSRAWGPVRRAADLRLADARLALVDDDTRTRHEAMVTEMRAHLLATTYSEAA